MDATGLNEQRSADKAVMAALVACVPPAWRRAVLTAEVSPGPEAGTEAYSVAVVGADGSAAEPSDDLFGALRRLSVAFRRHGAPWRRAVYIAEKIDGGWAFESEYGREGS